LSSALAVVLALTAPLSGAAAESAPTPAAKSQSEHDHSGMDHSQHDHAAMDHSQHDQAEMDHSEHEGHAMHGDAGGEDPHAAHRAMMQQTGYRRSEHQYNPKDVDLLNQRGDKTSLLTELSVDKPVILNFVFATCTTICPVLSGSFASTQKLLGDDRDKVSMISITIDPEHDTPEILANYAGVFGAGPQWQFLTGRPDDIVAVQRAFDVYRGNKMSHEPITLLKAAGSDTWVRMNGLVSGADIVNEYNHLVAH
jgi:protein SCO1/2